MRDVEKRGIRNGFQFPRLWRGEGRKDIEKKLLESQEENRESVKTLLPKEQYIRKSKRSAPTSKYKKPEI